MRQIVLMEFSLLTFISLKIMWLAQPSLFSCCCFSLQVIADSSLALEIVDELSH